MARKNKQDLTKFSSAAVKAISIPYLLFLITVSQILVLWLSTREEWFPGSEIFRQILSTGAEVTAGLYGITMAGYTFFLSRIDGLTASDATLDYVVAGIKNRYKYLIWYITATVAATLSMSILLIYYPEDGGLMPAYFYRVICNEFLLFLGFSVGLILYYSLDVIDPNRINKEAARQKKRLTLPGSPAGSATELIELYDRIERNCNACVPDAVLNQIREHKGNRFAYTLELLQELQPSMRAMLPDLWRVHRYYCCMVNCTPMTASEEICITARRLCEILEK